MATMEEIEAQLREGSRCRGAIDGQSCRRSPAPGDLFCPDHRPTNGLVIFLPEEVRQRVARFCHGSVQEQEFVRRCVLDVLERLERT